MRRALMTALTAALVTGMTAGPPASSRQRDDDWRTQRCRYQSLEPGTWTQREENLTAACVVRRLGADRVRLSDVMRIADCESNWNRVAYNPAGYAGLFQHSTRYWSDRVSSLMPESWRIGPWTRWQNSRSQLVTTIVMVRHSGWSAWSCR